MNDKVINSLIALGLIAVIGVMSWRDMHPKVEINDATWAQNMLTYYAGAGITPAMIPDDNKPLTIDLGTFSYAADGKTVWISQSMAPVTFAQRQVNLQFDFSSLPQNPAETVQKIKTVSDDWVHKGDTINVLVLDYSPAKVDAAAYTAFLKTVHDAFKRPYPYVIYAGINISWHDDVLKALQDVSAQFVARLPEKQISPDLFTQLAAIKYNLVLQYPAGTNLDHLDVSSLKKLPSLSGVELTLDANKPLPKKEDKIGLFTKL
jgi:hypothetical protein